MLDDHGSHFVFKVPEDVAYQPAKSPSFHGLVYIPKITWTKFPAFAGLTTTLPFSWQLLGSILLSGGFTTAIRIVEFVAAIKANLLVRSSETAEAGRASVPVL